jgi:hypothetical protein
MVRIAPSNRCISGPRIRGGSGSSGMAMGLASQGACSMVGARDGFTAYDARRARSEDSPNECTGVPNCWLYMTTFLFPGDNRCLITP